MSQDIYIPIGWPGTENEAERKFANCMRNGQPCAVGHGGLPEDPEESGPKANVIRGDLVRFFCQNKNDGEYSAQGTFISLVGAYIIGSIDLRFTRISYALDFSCCYFSNLINIAGSECVSLNLAGSQLAKGLMADGSNIKNGVGLTDGFFAEDEVRFLGANIGEDLDCGGGEFSNELYHWALNAERLTVSGNVLLNREFSAKGEVRLLGANIGGQLNCEDGEFCHPGHDALNVERMTTKGGVFLSGNFSAEGQVRLSNAHIDGALDCTGRKFHNPNECALDADRIVVRENVMLLNLSSFPFEGKVILSGARIGRDLFCLFNDSHVSDRFALDVRNAEIAGQFVWVAISDAIENETKNNRGFVNLRNAKTNILLDNTESWELFRADLRGFTYDQFIHFGNIESRIEWLANRPDKVEFSRQPYEQAAKALYNAGDYNDAREILLAMERLYTNDPRTPRLHRIWRRFWGVVAGYGYRIHYMVYWILFFVFAGTLIFGIAAYNGKIVPHQTIVLAKEEYQAAINRDGMAPIDAARVAIPNYPGFNPLVFSADVFVPLFSLHQESFWAPHPGKSDLFQWLTQRKGEFDPWWLLLLWYWFQIMAGWILTSALIYYITGLLRPRQISGGQD